MKIKFHPKVKINNRQYNDGFINKNLTVSLKNI